MSTLKKYHFSVRALSVAAAVFYSSWPLGYWLNPAVSKNSLASGLESVSQPYHVLFIAADVISGALVVALCLVLWQKIKVQALTKPLPLMLICILLFGFGTIYDALLPERCVPSLQQCPNFTHDHTLLLHGILSIAASLFLFASLCIVWFKERHSVLLNSLLIGYILFGLISLAEAILPGTNGNWSQHYYITLCSLWLLSVPYAMSQVAVDSSVLLKQRA